MKIRQLWWLLPLLAVTGYMACRKVDSRPEEKMETAPNIEKKFFDIPAATKEIVRTLAGEIEERNKTGQFIENFAKTRGYALWDKAIISRLNEQEAQTSYVETDSATPDTIIYVPLVLPNTSYTNGFIRAIIGDSIEIADFTANQYDEFPFGSGGGVTTAHEFASFIMLMDNRLFGYSYFSLTDPRLLGSTGSTPVNTGISRTVKLASVTEGSLSLTEMCTGTIYTISWLEPTPESCTCGPVCFDWWDGCEPCSNLVTITITVAGDGGCGGGGSTTPVGGTTGGITYPVTSGGVWNPGPVGGGGTGPIGFVPLEDPPAPELPPCDKVAPLKNDEYFKGYINNNLKPTLTGVQEFGLLYKEDHNWPTGIVIGPPGKCEVSATINDQTTGLRNYTHTHYNTCEYPLFSPHDFKEIGDFYNMNKYLFAQSSLLEPYFTYGLVTNAGYYIMVIDNPEQFESFLKEYFSEQGNSDEKKLTEDYDSYDIRRTNDVATNEKRFLEFIKKKELGIKVLKANSDLSSYNLLSLSGTGELISTPCQ